MSLQNEKGEPIRTSFDPRRVLMTFNGIEIKGFADGSYYSVEHTDDAIIETRAPAPPAKASGTIGITLHSEGPPIDLSALVVGVDYAFRPSITIIDRRGRVRTFDSAELKFSRKRLDKKDNRRRRMARKKRRGWA